MNILATAYPNRRYMYCANFKGVTLEARRAGNQVRFYELLNGVTRKCLTRDTVKSLFRPGSPIDSQPFHKKGNEQFYALLKRTKPG